MKVNSPTFSPISTVSFLHIWKYSVDLEFISLYSVRQRSSLLFPPYVYPGISTPFIEQSILHPHTDSKSRLRTCVCLRTFYNRWAILLFLTLSQPGSRWQPTLPSAPSVRSLLLALWCSFQTFQPLMLSSQRTTCLIWAECGLSTWGSMFGIQDIGKLKLDVKIWVMGIFEEWNIHSFHQILNTQVKKISTSANKYAGYNLLTVWTLPKNISLPITTLISLSLFLEAVGFLFLFIQGPLLDSIF